MSISVNIGCLTSGTSSKYGEKAQPEGHPYYNVKNKKIVGKFKDECHGRPIAEFVGLRPKMYSILKAPTLQSYKTFDESLMTIHWAKSEVKLNHSVYVDHANHDLSEYWKFNFWCTQIKHKYGKKVQLCNMGTYSILTSVGTEDFYADMQAIAEHYDFSDKKTRRLLAVRIRS